MKRWIPHIHAGGLAEECICDDEGGRDGWYVNVCWLGFMVSFGVSSIYAERRLMAQFRNERLAREAVAARGDQAQSSTPTTGDSKP
jgi:hypothetical protein